MTPAALKSAREALGLTQDGLARSFGVSRAMVARWEGGVYPVPPWVELALNGMKRK